MLTDYYNREIEIGDHIKTPRCNGVYTHHGVYIGDNKVIHFSGELADGIVGLISGKKELMIEYESIDNFELGCKSIIVNKIAPTVIEDYTEFLKNTERYLGPKQYNLITYNCEHFANEITRNECKSDQVNAFTYASLGSAISITAVSLIMHAGILIGGVTGTVVFYGIRKLYH